MFAHICSILIALRSSGGNCCLFYCSDLLFFFKSAFVPPSTFPNRSGDNGHESALSYLYKPYCWPWVRVAWLHWGIAFSSSLLLAKPVKIKYGDANTYWNEEVWWQCSSCSPLPQHWEPAFFCSPVTSACSDTHYLSFSLCCGWCLIDEMQVLPIDLYRADRKWLCRISSLGQGLALDYRLFTDSSSLASWHKSFWLGLLHDDEWRWWALWVRHKRRNQGVSHSWLRQGLSLCVNISMNVKTSKNAFLGHKEYNFPDTFKELGGHSCL